MKATNKVYTPEEIKSISENLMKAFGRNSIPLFIDIDHLVDKDKQKSFNFIKGEQFVFFNPLKNKGFNIEPGWHILEVTYQRLDLVFFKIKTSKTPNQEQYANKTSNFVLKLMPINVNLDRFRILEQNLPLFEFDKGKNNPVDITITKGKNNEFIKII